MLVRVDFFPELLADQMINNILNIVSQVRRLKNQARVLGIICHGIKVTLTYIKFANIAIFCSQTLDIKCHVCLDDCEH